MSSYRRPIAYVTASLLLAAQILWFWHATIEDAYISFRYARNWAQGLGLVFNPGERVEGYTNFSWTLLLGLAQRLGVDPILASKIMGVLATLAAVAVIIRIARGRISHDSAPLALWLAAASTSLAFWTVAGLETPLYLLLITLSLALYLPLFSSTPPSGWRAGLYALPLALASLTRPEALGLALLLMGWHFYKGNRRDSARALLLYLLIFLPFLAWRWQYYGALIPNSLQAKAGFFTALRTQPENFWLLSRSYLGNWALKWGLIWWLPLAWAARRHAALPPLLITRGYTLLVAALGAGDWMPLQRLILPALAAWIWIALMGWERLRGRRRRLAHLLLLLLILAQVDLPALASLTRDTRHLDAWWGETMPVLARIADDDATPMATTVLGRTGYYFPGPVLDAFGLSNAAIAKEGHPMLRLGRSDWPYVLAQNPTFILINDPQPALRRQLAQEQSYFWLPLPTPPDFPLLLLVRADSAEEAASTLEQPLRPADDPAMDQLLARRYQERQQQALGPLYERFCDPIQPQCRALWLLLKP
jgi:hypothetical protein